MQPDSSNSSPARHESDIQPSQRRSTDDAPALQRHPANDAPPLQRRRERGALKAIAVFEGIKGVAAIAASLGVLELVHHDTRRLAMALIGHFGLNPLNHYPSLLLHYAEILQDANLRNLMLLALGYAAVRLAEAYGLWRDRAWAEWLAALSGGLYVPFEAQHLLHRPSLINAGVLLANVAVVAFMVWRLYHRARPAAAATSAGT